MACSNLFNERKVENGNYPPPPSLRSLPSVALGSAPLRGYRMTSSHSSKDPLRHPVSGGQFAGAALTVVTDSPPETGASTPQGGGGG